MACMSTAQLGTFLVVVILAVPELTASARATDRPTITSPVISVHSADTGDTVVQVWGEGFGAPSSGASVLVRGEGVRRAMRATSPHVRTWTSNRVVFEVPGELTRGAIKIRVRGRASLPATIANAYEYRAVDLQPDGAPLELALDGLGRVWINAEFHTGFQMWDPVAGTLERISIPHPPDPGPFATMLFGDHRTQVSDAGEDIVVDPDGMVWLTEGGALPYRGAYPNHSRIVRYDPRAPAEADRYRVYNVPGDNNGVVGLAYDSARKRVWYTENATAKDAQQRPQPAKLVSFDPSRVPFDNAFDFATSLDGLRCEPGEDDGACLRGYALPPAEHVIGHVAIDSSGAVWYATYVGDNAIGRLDPTTGTVTTYPLPRPIGTSMTARYLGSGPLEMRIASDGDVVVQEFFDCQVTRFDHTRFADPACQKLNESGDNPCMRSLILPDADLARQFAAGIGFDGEGRLWVSLGSADEDVASTNAIGYVTADWSRVVMLPPLGELGRADAQGRPFSISGVTVNAATGDVWFGEYQRQRLGRLTPLDVY